jgi:spore coat protein CotH
MRKLLMIPVSLAMVAGLTACSLATGLDGTTTAAGSTASGAELFDSSTVHDIALTFDEADYDAVIATYQADGTKDWLSATITIDGTTFENVGLRLKGNSSLRGLQSNGASPSGDESGDPDDPATLPWLVRLDEYVDGQTYQGRSELIVRGNNTETSLNEALALALLGEAGLATQQATPVRFTVNGGEAELRLVIESPDDELWSDDVFGDDGITYEAETEGDYSYRGSAGSDYADAFTVQAGDDDLQPVADLLTFVDQSSDAEFAASLGEYLDVDRFATYLALENLIANDDDIDGPGNNSYLRWDADTGLVTVVAWDHNLAFGGFGHGGAAGGGQGGPQQGGGGMPQQQGGQGATQQGGPGGGMQKDNPLTTRFLADPTFSAMVDDATSELQAALYDSGTAQGILDEWVDVLESQAGDLVDSATVESDAARIEAYFTDD